jgi:hypothetical protein
MASIAIGAGIAAMAYFTMFTDSQLRFSYAKHCPEHVMRRIYQNRLKRIVSRDYLRL